jgi:hypothetical protein
MSVLAPARAHHRPVTERAALALLLLLGVTATAGGLALATGLGGEQVMAPEEWLADVPLVDSWLVPGLVLGVGFGLGSLFTAWGLWRRPRPAVLGAVERATGHHWSWLATLLLGVGHVVWILLELVYLPEPSWLQPFYLAVGLGLVALPLTRSMRSHLALSEARS